MYKWYADDSALKKKHGDSKRSVFLFGGILISRQDEVELSNLMKEVKRDYTGEDMSLKYNMRDLKELYERFNRKEEYDTFLRESAIWRKRIVQESLQTTCQLS